MRVDFYYWSYQCPLNYSMIQLLKCYEDRLDVHYHDISNDPQTTKALRMFSPTLTLVDGHRRYYTPLKPAFLDALCMSQLPEEKPYRLNLSTVEKTVDIQPINAHNVHIASGCTGQTCHVLCDKKSAFLNIPSDHIPGYLNIGNDGRLLGGVEYIPSIDVPYDIPRDNSTAFITCVYGSSTSHDYKSGPLQALEHHLSGRYSRLLVISGESGVFPNGDTAFFQRHGYQDMGIVWDGDDYCSLHLMSKSLK